MGTLQGQVALVVGASRGVGRACAEALARDGADIALAGVRPERLADTAAFVRGLGRRCLELGCDVADDGQVETTVQRTVSELGRLDILVNSAVWMDPPNTLLDLPLEVWNRTIAVDLNGVFHLSRHCARAMLERGTGRIIHISSDAAKRGTPLRGAYCAAKAGLNNFVGVLAEELTHTEIKVNAVCPMGIAGEHNKEMRALINQLGGRPRESDESYEAVRKDMMQPEEVADLVAFIASAAGRHINGQAYTIGELKASGFARVLRAPRANR